MSTRNKADRWRRLMKMKARVAAPALESTAPPPSVRTPPPPRERVRQAREALVRLVKDRLGGDASLLDQVERIALTGEEALDVLQETPDEVPTDAHLSALEAIVAFDGTRPSFLVKDQQIDFDSSFNTGDWKNDLKGVAMRLPALIACVGRVELHEQHIGTAFLVTDRLAITNRHVAQQIATFNATSIKLKSDVNLDFGREDANHLKSFDRRHVEAIVFAGSQAISSPIDHTKLDLAVLRLSASKLSGAERTRHLSLKDLSAKTFNDATFVAAIGYPANPALFVPANLQSQFDDVLKRLLEGEGGAKRFAPGEPEAIPEGSAAPWTVGHDATTINGNSGSALVVLNPSASGRPLRVAGLHYGGEWSGERINWAHRLSATGNSLGFGTTKTFRDFCKKEGIAL